MPLIHDKRYIICNGVMNYSLQEQKYNNIFYRGWKNITKTWILENVNDNRKFNYKNYIRTEFVEKIHPKDKYFEGAEKMFSSWNLMRIPDSHLKHILEHEYIK